MNKDKKIIALENELQALKRKNLNKKDLQIQRNRITAQQSRDRKKLEMDYLKNGFIQMRETLMGI